MAARAINRLLVGLFIDLNTESEPKFNVDELTPLIRLVKMVIEDWVLVLVIRTVHARVTVSTTRTCEPLDPNSSSIHLHTVNRVCESIYVEFHERFRIQILTIRNHRSIFSTARYVIRCERLQ